MGDMMAEPRKPIFGFLWPKPDPDAPVDADFRQVRRVRVTPRGPVRVLSLVVGTVLLVALTGSLMLTTVQAGVNPLTLLGSAVSATALVLVLRGWVVGTYVNDAGVTVERTWRMIATPWSDVAAVVTQPERAPFLGGPIRTTAERCILRRRDGTQVATHVYETSPDLWLRPEAFDMARLRLENWLDQR